MKSILFLIIFLMPFYSSAQNAKDKFSVVIEGTRSHLDYIKARSELRMARSTKFCRGSKMPKSVGEWSCKSTAPRVSNCVLEYKCKFVNKRFNRASESRRLRSNLKGIPHLKSKYTISLLYKDKKQILEEIDNQVPTPAPSKKVVASSFSSQKLKSTKPKPKVKIRKKQITKVKKRTSSQKKKITKRKIETSEEDLEELSFLKESEEKNSLESETVSPLEEDQNIEESQFETKT
ncbi:hypothetical protein, partial [Halobacteriovorax sp.]|uniref:hypothetical protein n=1 Tax=Halobacteriovorax sp. TaxID=2020862 RepID=UPI0035633F88